MIESKALVNILFLQVDHMNYFSKKFLLITHELTYTGAPRSLLNLAKCLLEEGHTVAVWSLETGEFFREFTALGIDVTYVTLKEIEGKDGQKTISGYDCVIAGTVFCLDVALATQETTTTALYLGEAANIRKIVSDFSIDASKLKKVKNIVCVSSYAKKRIERFTGREDVYVIHNYVEDYNFRGEMFTRKPGPVNFIVSGTIEPRKGQDIAIKAFRSISGEDADKKNARLYLLGKAPAWSRKFFKSLDIGGRVFYRNEIQERTDLLEYYKTMDVFIVSSRDEACSMVALEAAMLGKAVIVSGHVGAGYITDKEYRFKSGNADELAKIMRRFVEKPELIAEAGRFSREAYKKYAVKSVVKHELKKYLGDLGMLSESEAGKSINKKDISKGSETEDKLNVSREISRLKTIIGAHERELAREHKKVVPIVLATESKYAPFAATVIQSIYENRSSKAFYSIYILYDDTMTHYMYNMLEGIDHEGMSVHLLDVKECFDEKELYLSGHYSMQMYYRWLIPELFDCYKKVLYLDCDVAVLSDPAKLMELDLHSKSVGMVCNTVRNSFRSYVEETLGLQTDEYYNSGVILFNTKEFNKRKIRKKCMEFIGRDRDLLCPDQDAINVVCKGDIYRMPDEWNFQWHHLIKGVEIGGFTADFRERYEKVIKDGPKIIHYTSYVKPWNERNIKYADVFWKYFEKTPCYDYAMKKYGYGRKGLERGKNPIASGRIEESVHYQERIDFLQYSLDETRNSSTYRIGRMITAVPRRLRHIFTGAPI